MITDRRFVLAGMALVAATPLALAETKKMAATGKMLAASTAATDLPVMPMMDLASVKTASQFYAGVLPRAELSLAVSAIALDTATNKDAHEFAGFELGEAITVNMVLKNLGSMSPAMDDSAKTTLDMIKSAGKGPAFDRAYIGLQLRNHQDLRDWADAYLHNSAGNTDPAEIQGQSLATLMLAVFKEHTAICKRITAELMA